MPTESAQFAQEFDATPVQPPSQNGQDEPRQYVNQSKGPLTLLVTRFERSKNGRAVVAEFESNDDTTWTHLWNLDRPKRWQRQQAMREIRHFVAAVLNKDPKTVRGSDLFNGDVLDKTVFATPEKTKTGFVNVKFSHDIPF